jgi:tryptophanyl-tRNA synthetase
LNNFLDPIRERRAHFESDPDMVNDILAQGTHQAQLQAQETMLQVRAAMGLTSYIYSEVKTNKTAHRSNKSAPIQGLAFV